MAANRFELFTQLVGDEQKLPPRLPTPPPSHDTSDQAPPNLDDDEQDSKIVDAFGNLKTYDDLGADTAYPAPPAPAYANRHALKSQQNTSVAKSEDAVGFNFTLDPRKGEPSELGMSFCPFLAIAKFPYKYVATEFRQPLATAFFDEGKIYDRSWDLYYVWSEQSAKAIALIPLSKAQALIDEVNAKFTELQWQFESHNEEEGLLLIFDDPNPDHRPRFLGGTDSRGKYDFLLENADPYGNIDMDSSEDRSLEAFQAKIALAVDAAKNKNKKQKKERHEKTVLNRQSMGQQLRQTQMYLGLVPAEASTSSSSSKTGVYTPINIEQPALHPRDSDIIIIAVDVEAYEKAQGIITEVGVSTLDTRDLQDTPPGKNGQNWQQFIRGRHFRVIENKAYVNGQFVAGCPENFDFGETEWASLKTMASVLTKCFHEPFSKPTNSADTIEEGPNNKRNIVLLGHDIGQDIQYCHKLGFSVLGRGNMLATIDTKAMYQAYTRDASPRGLGGIMSDFDFTAWHLHNAGNDAVYTIWAMLATCVQDAAERGTVEAKKKLEERAQEELNSAIEAAKEKAKEDAEGWDLEEEGGVVVGPVPPSASGHYTAGGAPLDI